MFKKWQAITQTVITSGCLQVVYLNGNNLDRTDHKPIKAYAEHLDILVVFDGELSIKIFNQQHTLKPGDVFFYSRSTFAEVIVSSENFSGARLRFIKNKIAHVKMPTRFAASMFGNVIVSQKIKNHCLNYIRLIDFPDSVVSEKEVRLIEKENQEIIETIALMIESKHQALNIISHNLNEVELVVRAVNLFESSLTDTPKIKDIVKELGVSHSYFVRTFKRYVGVNPAVFSRTLKINISLSLISADIDSLSETSYLLGFSDQSHFSNSFRETLQFTPGTVAIRTIQ